MKPVLTNLGILLTLLSPLAAKAVQAQTIIPAPDGTGTLVTPNGNQLTIQGGQLSGDGANLFHSFLQFGLSSDQIANFAASPALQNILSRVVGGDPSVINGLIQVTGGNPNLFLLNPAGIIFGSNASLNVPAAFTATTANGVGFDSGQWFSALDGNDYAGLVGTPGVFAFTGSQPGAIVNLGNLSVTSGQDLTLLGGTVVSTGQLSAPGGQVTVAAVPGTSLVRVSLPGSLLSLDIQPLPVGAPLPGPLPVSLPELLTGAGWSNASALTVNGNGDVVLTSSGMPILSGDGAVTGSVDAQNALLVGDRNLTLVDSQLRTTGNLTLQAKDTVQIRDSVSVPFQAQAGGNLTIQGDQGIDILALNHLQTAPFQSGGDLSLVSDGVVSGDSHFTSGGNFAILDRSGNPGTFVSFYDPILTAAGDFITGAYTGVALKVTAAGNITFGGNIRITGPDTVAVDPTSATDTALLNDFPSLILRSTGGNVTVNGSIDTSVTLGGGTALGGPVILSAPGNITVGAINSSATVNATGGPAIATAGLVNLNAGGSIATGSINSSARATTISSSVNAASGAVTLSATTGTIATGAIDASASGLSTGFVFGGNFIGTAANVTLTTLANGGNISFANINAQAAVSAPNASPSPPSIITATAGNVQVAATGLVQGSLPGNTINTQATATSLAGLPVTANNGSVQIIHDGGTGNVPFVVGVVGTPNGLGGSILTGSAPALASGSFSTIGTVTIPATATSGSVATTFNNTPPVLTANPSLPTIALGQSTTFGFSDLAATVVDTNADVTSIQITSLTAGTLTVNGVVATVGTTIVAGDVLVYTPLAGVTGAVDVLTIQANDRVSVSNTVTIQANIVVPDRPPEEVPKSRLGETAFLSADSSCGVDRGVAERERSYTDEFAEYAGESGSKPAAKGLSVACQALASISGATGIKPALVYVGFVASGAGLDRAALTGARVKQERRDDDELELLIVTGKGSPIRKRIPAATRAKVMAAAQAFRAEVTNPDSEDYLPPSQQLYQWMIAPIEADLKSTDIQNLVFLVDPGLRSLPFAALHDGKDFLIKKFSVGLMPSLTLTNTRYVNIKPLKVLALGVSEFSKFSDLKNLPAVPFELASVLNVWKSGEALLNTGATLSNLKALRGRQSFRIIHLATHADFKTGPAGESYIQLWNDRLRLDQVRQLGWNNPPVELLVLSACRTALGDEEAELGFAGLALQTGVKSAIASLWYVSDAGTAAMMTELYEYLKTAPIKAEALRQVQADLASGRIFIKDGKLQGLKAVNNVNSSLESINLPDQSLSHPYYWAAFTMIGNPW